MLSGRDIGTRSVIALRHAALLLAAISVVASVRVDAALGQKLDPTKRASISTTTAVEPQANPIFQSDVSSPRVVRMSKIPIRQATVSRDRAAIEVRDDREKRIITGEIKRPDLRTVDGNRAGDRPAIIPALDQKRFREMIAAYENGRTPANEMLSSTITVGGKELDLGEINRFASPRRALEAQGIPVIPAASAQEVESDSETIPYSAESSGGASR